MSHLEYWSGHITNRGMAPVTTRRAQVRKKKVAAVGEVNAKKCLSTNIIRESKQLPKATCFFDESLLACDICLEVMHNAMNVSPCNHKFCAGCIYEWNSLNSRCPKCRWKAVDITRDTTLNLIIEQYLITFPEKRRDAAQLIELDERELDHLEKWDRRRCTKEEHCDVDMRQYFESEESDDFEPQNEPHEENNEDGSVLEHTSSERWSDDDNMIDSYGDDGDGGGSDILDEYLSRINLEKARIERLRREKEERERLKEIEERSRRTNVATRKEKYRRPRCGNGARGRNSTRARSTTERNASSDPSNSSTSSVVTRSMSRRLYV